MTGTMEFVLQEERGVRKVRIDIDSRWLSPDCGTVKPEAPVRVKG